MQPGPQTLVWKEYNQRMGSVWRLELWDESVGRKLCTLLDHIPHNDQVPQGSVNPADDNTQPRYKVTINMPNWQCNNCSLRMIEMQYDQQGTCRQPSTTDGNFTTNNCRDNYYSCADINLQGTNPINAPIECPAFADWPYMSVALAENVYFRDNVGERGLYNAYGFLQSAPSHFTASAGVCMSQGTSTTASSENVAVDVGIVIFGVTQAFFEKNVGLFKSVFANQTQVPIDAISIYNLIPYQVFGGITGLIVQIEVQTPAYSAQTQANALQRIALDQAGIGSPLAIALTAARFVAGTNNVFLFNTPVISPVGDSFFDAKVTVANRVVAYIVSPIILILISIVGYSAGRSMTRRCLGSGSSKDSIFIFKMASLGFLTFTFLGTTIAVGTYYWANLSSMRFGLWQTCPGDGACRDPTDPLSAPGVETIIILRATTLLAAILACVMYYRVVRIAVGKLPASEATSAFKIGVAVCYLDLFNMAVWAGYYNDVLETIYSSTLFPGYSVKLGYSFIFVIASWVLGFPGCVCLYQLGLIANNPGGGGGKSKEHGEGGRETNTTGTTANMSAPAVAPRPGGGGGPPKLPRAGSGQLNGLPPGWSEQKSAKGETYYFHAPTQTSSWERPKL